MRGRERVRGRGMRKDVTGREAAACGCEVGRYKRRSIEDGKLTLTLIAVE